MNPTEPAYIYRATADRIIDGDTFVADVDLGFNVHAKVNVRLYGIDAPEHDAPGGADATTYLADMLTGWPFLLRSHKDQRSFARWVCEVFINGESVADAMLDGGHAVPWHAVPYPPAKP